MNIKIINDRRSRCTIRTADQEATCAYWCGGVGYASGNAMEVVIVLFGG